MFASPKKPINKLTAWAKILTAYNTDKELISPKRTLKIEEKRTKNLIEKCKKIQKKAIHRKGPQMENIEAYS